MKIATMEFIRYHQSVRKYMMNDSNPEPIDHPVWVHAAKYVEPEIDYLRGYIDQKTCLERQSQLCDELYFDVTAEQMRIANTYGIMERFVNYLRTRVADSKEDQVIVKLKGDGQ